MIELQKLDGSIVLLPDPTLAELARHAERFGSEGVYETGELFLNGSELVQLDAELTRLDSGRQKRFEKVPTRKRMSTEGKMKTVLFLTAEGLSNERIANQLGTTARHVQRLRSLARKEGLDGMRAPSG